MFARLVGESFVRNPRRVLLAAAALAVGMAVTTATLSVALDVGDRLALEFRSLGANLLVTPESDTLPLQIGGVDYRPVDEGAYLKEADLGKLKTVFWRHNILGFTPFLQFSKRTCWLFDEIAGTMPTLIGTWYDHDVRCRMARHFQRREADASVVEEFAGVGLRTEPGSGGRDGTRGEDWLAKASWEDRRFCTRERKSKSLRERERAGRIPITITGMVSTGELKIRRCLCRFAGGANRGAPGQFRNCS